MSDPEIIDSSAVPKNEAPALTPTQPEVIAEVPGAVDAAVEKGVSVSKEMVTEVPTELGGEAVRAAVEADAQARTEDMAERDKRETTLGPATVTSKVPPQFQQPPTPEV